MTVWFRAGRRMPKSMMLRVERRMRGLLSLQENIWLIVDNGLKMAKKKCDSSPEHLVTISIHKEEEVDALDPSFVFEWNVVTITSPVHEKEVEEQNDCLGFYDNFSALKNVLKERRKDIEAVAAKVGQAEGIRKLVKIGMRKLRDHPIAGQLAEYGIILEVTNDWKGRVLSAEESPS